MTIHLSHPDRRVEVKGPKRVKELLRELNLVPEAHLVIRGDDLMTEDEMLKDDDQIEVRPVISGGSAAGSWLEAIGNGKAIGRGQEGSSAHSLSPLAPRPWLMP
jgi:sulfur carrier protein